MKDFNIENYMLNNSTHSALRYELEGRLYDFGDHKLNQFTIKNPLFNLLSLLFESLILFFLFLSKKLIYRNNFLGNRIINGSYGDFKYIFEKENYTTFGLPWTLNKLNTIFNLVEFATFLRFRIRLKRSSFIELVSDDFLLHIEKIELLFSKSLSRNKISACILANDVGFFEKILIDQAKKKKIPTFIMVHGAAQRYSNYDLDNSSDYLCVHGINMKDEYLKIGLRPEKIIITGHFNLSNRKLPKALKNSIDNIIVCSKPIFGVQVDIPSEVTGRSKYSSRVSDRGASIYYLDSVKMVLIKLGVKNVKLRLHPSENPKWYIKYIDNDFFTIDYEPLNKSLDLATMVIGPTTSLFFDSIYAGVNFVVYEPQYDDGFDLQNTKVSKPFDGSDTGIPVAKTEEMLFNLIECDLKTDLNVVNNYIQNEVELSEVLDIISNFDRNSILP